MSCCARFPLEGGTGAIWKAVARLLPQEKQVHSSSTAHQSVNALCTLTCTVASPLTLPCYRQKYGEEYTVVSLDKDAKTATLAGGRKIRYEALLSTMPLDLTLQWLGQQKWADELSHRWAPHTCISC